MRRLCAAAIALACLAPISVAAENDTGKCRRITRQIAHFEDVSGLARARGDALWENETERHIGALAQRRHKLCPEQYPDPTLPARVAANTRRAFREAGQTVLRYFSLGAY